MKMRRADPKDLDSIFMMGFDTWAGGSSAQDYLKDCRSSVKYARGQWYVLEDAGRILSSLILYRFDRSVYGIGSIATPPALRKKGFASRLVRELLEFFEKESEASVFLFSDITPEFYQRFGFLVLPAEYQKHPGSVCMVRPAGALEWIRAGTLPVPKYF